MPRRLLAVTALASLFCSGTSFAQSQTPSLSLEQHFDAAIDSNDQLVWLKAMSSAPNQVGSPHDRANSEFLLGKFREFGWDARIETYQVLYPTPISTRIEMIAPRAEILGGQEPAVAADPTSANLAGALPPYLAYQGDGDVTAPVVYVNFGMPGDYEALARRGIDVRGKIVIARYGGGWRGLKPKLAQDHGAAGCIIYSDPADDGYTQADVYPKGGARPPFGVQRGSVQDMAISPGDPLTPGIGATVSAKRLTRAEAPTILKIPALPISYGDAVKLLREISGPVAPAGWRGALPITYHIGGDDSVKVHLAVKSSWALTPIHDVIAVLKGSQESDRWIVRGNHYDAWVFGASDPLSGQVAMLSEAKALGKLYRDGWRPRRTIVYASWDGEEPGLLGSTEWAEDHAAELKAKALIYLNTDNNGRGVLQAAGSHDYQHLLNQVASDVVDPETGRSISQRLRAALQTRAYAGGEADAVKLAAARSGDDLVIGPLGSGSDYSTFLQHLGIPAINLGFGGEDESDGVYHSAYDSFHHMTTFDDPGLRYGAALSKMTGRLVIRLADAATPLQRFGDFASTVGQYAKEVKELARSRREQDDVRAELLASGSFRLASDPLKPVGPPIDHPRTPVFDFTQLEQAVGRLNTAATAYDAAFDRRGATLSADVRQRLNDRLADIDQLLLDDAGLPGRPWFRNLVYAPGRFTGYGAKTLPGIREAIEERRFDDVPPYIVRTARVIDAYATRLDQARAILAQGE